MNAKIKMRQYSIFSKRWKFDTADIKYSTIYSTTEKISVSSGDWTCGH